MFKKTISWNKYRFEITTQPKKNNLDYMIDPIVFSFKNDLTNPKRDSFGNYYIPLVEIKDIDALIDNELFLINL